MEREYARARKELWRAGEALLAYRKGEDSLEPGLPMVGALLVAEFLGLIRSLGKEEQDAG